METTTRYDVVDKNGTKIISGMFRRENADDEAARLNAEGLDEFKPYEVRPRFGVVR